MPNSPYVLCHFPNCEYHIQPIVLPLSNPPKNDPHQLLWPLGDWRAYLACPGCGQVLLRTADDVRWKELSIQDQSRQEGKRWFLVAFECAPENCGTLIEFHVLKDSKILGLTEIQLREKLRDGIWNGVSPCERHPIAATANQQIDVYLDEGEIRGYYPPVLRLERPCSVTCPNCGESSGDHPRESFQIGNRLECKACYMKFPVTAEHVRELEE
jgi:hypothetical protein